MLNSLKFSIIWRVINIYSLVSLLFTKATCSVAISLDKQDLSRSIIWSHILLSCCTFLRRFLRRAIKTLWVHSSGLVFVYHILLYRLLNVSTMLTSFPPWALIVSFSLLLDSVAVKQIAFGSSNCYPPYTFDYSEFASISVTSSPSVFRMGHVLGARVLVMERIFRYKSLDSC